MQWALVIMYNVGHDFSLRIIKDCGGRVGGAFFVAC